MVLSGKRPRAVRGGRKLQKTSVMRRGVPVFTGILCGSVHVFLKLEWKKERVEYRGLYPLLILNTPRTGENFRKFLLRKHGRSDTS